MIPVRLSFMNINADIGADGKEEEIYNQHVRKKLVGLNMCGPRISAHALPLDCELDFYLKNDLFIKEMTWSRHLFLFYFKRVNKIRKKTLSVTPYFQKMWFVKNRIGFEGQVTYREGTVKTVAPL